MTPVVATVTDADAASSDRGRPREVVVLHVALPPHDGAARDLERHLSELLAELAPAATVRSLVVEAGHGPVDTAARVAAEIEACRGALSATERAEAVWRGTGATLDPRVVVDLDAREVLAGGRTIPLTYKEFELLVHLMRRPHRAVPRSDLLREVWHKDVAAGTTRTIDVHVRRLREKLGGCLQIVTVRGVGYRWDHTPDVVLIGSGDAD